MSAPTGRLEGFWDYWLLYSLETFFASSSLRHTTATGTSYKRDTLDDDATDPHQALDKKSIIEDNESLPSFA